MENIEQLKKQFAKQKAEHAVVQGFNYFVIIVGFLLLILSGFEIYSTVGKVATAFDDSITKPILIALWSFGFGLGVLIICAAGILSSLYDIQENTHISAFLKQKEMGIELALQNESLPDQSGM